MTPRCIVASSRALVLLQQWSCVHEPTQRSHEPVQEAHLCFASCVKPATGIAATDHCSRSSPKVT
jgi:hypothetical protein